MNVKITVREVGQRFATAADVESMDGATLYSTRDYPYGYDSSAYASAEAWATEHGHTVVEDDDE